MKQILILGLLIASNALAAPPPIGSEDYLIMQPFRDWINEQIVPGTNDSSCCNVSDGRPVTTRINKDGHYEAYVTHEKFPSSVAEGKDMWLEIPDEAIIKPANPTGVAILWYYYAHIYCFSPSNGV